MSAQPMRKRFEAWQASGWVHPFTCGGGGGPCSGVDLAFGSETVDEFVMVCPECGRYQDEPRGSAVWCLIASFNPPAPAASTENHD